MAVRKIGVEEELLLVDPDTGLLTAVAEQAVRAHEDDDQPGVAARPDDPEVERELYRQQIETMTEPCHTLDDLARQLRSGRRDRVPARGRRGRGSRRGPGPGAGRRRTRRVTRKPRYQRIRDEYGELARDALACAMHVHVDVDDDEQGVRVLDGIRPWLPVLLAVSANSPYWRGVDTGYASWRSQIWSRWPSHGTGEAYGDHATYDRVTSRLTEWGAALDDGMIYFDARLSQKFPTIEIRVADVCTDLDDAVLVAALARGLVTTVAADGSGEEWRSDLLRAMAWRASRFGIADRLVDPGTRELAPARDVVEALVGHSRDALEEAGDLELVTDLCERLFSRGNGAVQQRRVFEKTEALEEVVGDLVTRTEESATGAGTWLSG